MKLLSFMLYNLPSLVNYVALNSMKYYKSYVQIVELKQEVYASYFELKGNEKFPIDSSSQLVKAVQSNVNNYCYKQRNFKLLYVLDNDDFVSEEVEKVENEYILPYDLVNSFTTEEKQFVHLISSGCTTFEILLSLNITFTKYKIMINKIKKKINIYITYGTK